MKPAVPETITNRLSDLCHCPLARPERVLRGGLSLLVCQVCGKVRIPKGRV